MGVVVGLGVGSAVGGAAMVGVAAMVAVARGVGVDGGTALVNVAWTCALTVACRFGWLAAWGDEGMQAETSTTSVARTTTHRGYVLRVT